MWAHSSCQSLIQIDTRDGDEGLLFKCPWSMHTVNRGNLITNSNYSLSTICLMNDCFLLFLCLFLSSTSRPLSLCLFLFVLSLLLLLCSFILPSCSLSTCITISAAINFTMLKEQERKDKSSRWARKNRMHMQWWKQNSNCFLGEGEDKQARKGESTNRLSKYLTHAEKRVEWINGCTSECFYVSCHFSWKTTFATEIKRRV